jgi:dienelactone hydrolase
MKRELQGQQTRRANLALCLCVLNLAATMCRAREPAPVPSPSWEGAKTAWHGFDRYDFLMDEASLAIKGMRAADDEKDGIKHPVEGQRRCIVVVPRVAAPGNPWSWRGCYWDHQPQTEVELLRRGFHIAYIESSATLKPGRQWDAWYGFLTEKHGLSRQPAFIGMSRGGEYAYTWATSNPDKVSCIYAENPVLRSQMVKAPLLDSLAPLAKARVPLLHVCGSLDPWLESQTRALEKRYQELGGQITVILKEGEGRFPTAPKDPKPVVDFILKHALDFDATISREVLENYLSRSISMEGLLNGQGDLDDNLRMLKSTGAKFIGRSLCLWGGEANLLRNLERAKEQIRKVRDADPEMILQACVFEIVSTQVEQVPVPDWAFVALGQPVEKRNFRYADMIYPEGQRRNWGPNASVPDVSRLETKLWFYFLAVSYIDLGFEAIHFGQVEIMNRRDPNLAHWSQVLDLVRAYAAKHARRHLVLCDGHVPTGGLVREGHLLLDFHSFPLRVMEVPERTQEAILQVGFSDGIYGRSKGGISPNGWGCDHLPYLVELDNWGVSKTPGQAKVGGIWVWGYDEITWFAHQSQQYRSNWLNYAWDWVRRMDANGHLQMPGSRTMRSPLDNMRWYFANTPSPAVPNGLGDEEAIRTIWAADSARVGQPLPPRP